MLNFRTQSWVQMSSCVPDLTCCWDGMSDNYKFAVLVIGVLGDCNRQKLWTNAEMSNEYRDRLFEINRRFVYDIWTHFYARGLKHFVGPDKTHNRFSNHRIQLLAWFYSIISRSIIIRDAPNLNPGKLSVTLFRFSWLFSVLPDGCQGDFENTTY